MISADDITGALVGLGVSSTDTLYVHSGMQSALRVEGSTPEEKMDTVLRGLEAALPGGTLMMPTFTYSLCQGEPFDLEGSPSVVGMLTERFRHQAGVRRTPEPIFSTAIRGELPAEWEKRLFAIGDKDCFGDESVFAYLHAVDAKLLFFGVGFEYCTYLYLVEQRLGVPYRYMKDFSGDVIADNVRTPVTARYFVRDLESDVVNDFGHLARELEARGVAARTRIPKGPRLMMVGARGVQAVAMEQVERNPDYLLERGHACEKRATA